MKEVKKIILFLIFLSIVFGYVSIQKKVVKADTQQLETLNNNDLFSIKLNISENIYIEGVEIERYISNPIYEDGKIINFENTYYDTIVLSQNNLITERLSDNMYMKVKLDTLPAGYGSANIGYFVSKNTKSCEFDILKVEMCNVEYSENGEMDVVFKSSDDRVILVDYEISSIQLSNDEYSMSIITKGQTFYEDIKINVLNESSYIFDRVFCGKNNIQTTVINYNSIGNTLDDREALPFQPQYSNYELFQNDGSKFIIVYNPLTMNLEYVQRVADYIELINDFFCTNPNNNFPEPNSTVNGEYYIYLYNREMDNTLGYTLSINLPNENGSYVSLMYEVVSMEYLTNREYSFAMVLAHEYFHSICNTYTRNLKGWIDESFANFGGLLFMNSIRKGENFDTFTSNQLSLTFKEYLMYSNFSIDDCPTKQREYNSFLLPLYIYQKFGIQGIKDFLALSTSISSEFDCFDRMLDSRNTNFSDFYESYVLYNIYPYLGYDEIDSKYKDDWDYYNFFRNISIEDIYDSKKPENNSYELPYYANNIQRYSSPRKCDEYDIYYTIELSDYVPISIYQIIKYADNNMDTSKINLTTNSITIPLSYYDIEQDVDNVSFAIINHNRYSSSIKINTCTTVEHKIENIGLEQMIDVGEHLHKSNTIQYLKFTAPETEIYEIDFKIISSYDHLEVKNYKTSLVKVLDEYKNLIYKYEDQNNNIEAVNAINCKNIVMHFEKDKVYYLRFQTNYNCENFYVTIKKADTYENLVDLTDTSCIDQILNSGDYVYKINHIYPGFYKMNLSVQSNNEVMERDLIFVVFYRKNDEIKISKGLIIHSNGENNEFGFSIYSDREYYIGMLNCQEGYKYTLSSNIRIESTIEIKTDINENVSVGSEVYLNHGDCNGKTITEGYTRVIYPFKSNVGQSRLDYDWYSMDENKAIVSKYGTVTAMPIDKEEESVRILAVNKKIPSYASIIEFKIYKDHSNTIKNVKLTTDVREGGVTSGTEVTENGGVVGDTTIHVGYTRLICFDGKTSPSDNIQDYVWSSSNDQVVTVSEYGTIKVISNPFSPICEDDIWKEVEITGIYKYNSNFVAKIIIKVKK